MKTNRNIHTSSAYNATLVEAVVQLWTIGFLSYSIRKRSTLAIFCSTRHPLLAWADATGLVKQDFAWCRR